MRTAVIITAAGSGSRMGTEVMKQLLPLCGIPVLTRTLMAFETHEDIDEIVLTVPETEMEEVKNQAVTPFGFKKISNIVAGGGQRQASVYAGLNALSANTGWVLIHDGVRPLVSTRVISDVAACAKQGICGVSGVKTKDTVKITDLLDIVVETSIREQTWLVQTPQGFPYPIIMEAHKQALLDGFCGTDDSILAERMGAVVKMIAGDYRNIKLTTPEDMRIAEALLGG